MQIEKGEANCNLTPAFTTFKYREKEGWKKRTIDYIFMADNDYYKKNKCIIS